MEGFADLFADSASSGRLTNFSLTDFGDNLQKAKVSFGNVPLGIYRQGKKITSGLLHDKEKQSEFYKLVQELKFRGNYYASLRNFYDKCLMNFTQEDFDRGLYFYTFTFNNFRKELKFSFAPWTEKGKQCPFDNCDSQHYYQTVATETSSFLAEKETAKKKLGREIEGVNDLFAKSIQLIQKLWQPTNFKWVAVPELHKCQTSCHWPKKKQKKSKWKEHNQNACQCQEKHDCLRNWHIHMLATDFLPEKYQHEKCGLGKFADNGSPRGCWDHRGYIAHDIWPYGLVDLKRINFLRVNGKPIKSAEQVVIYLAKYLAKAFQMRNDKVLSEKFGLLKGMSIYKFFRVIYGYEGERSYIVAKIKKPTKSSVVFINNNSDYSLTAENDFGDYFTDDLKLKKNAKQILLKKEKFSPLPQKSYELTEILKLCLRYCSHSKIKKNRFLKPCQFDEHSQFWVQGKGWQVNCPIGSDHHFLPIIRWDFEFKGQKAYSHFQTYILPALKKLNLPPFQKFQDYQIKNEDYVKFARESTLPWNKEIREYEPLEEIGESAESKSWRETIPPELIYNHIYLKEIRSQISHSNYSWGLTTDKAMARYADY